MIAEDLARLGDLQEIDQEITTRERTLAGMNDGGEARARAAQLRAELETARLSFREMEANLLDSDLEMKSTEAKRKVCEEKLYGGKIRNPKELGDLEHEVQILAHHIDQHTDRVLCLMDEVEVQRQDVRAREDALKQAEAELETITAKYQEVTTRLGAELEELRGKRAQAAKGIRNAQLLRRYDEVRGRLGDPVLLVISEGVCSACHMTLSLDLVRRLKAASQMDSCENCGRILRWDAEAQEAIAGEG